MEHLPNKHLYLLKAILRNPSEIVRLLRVAWSTLRYRYVHRCAGAKTVVGEATVMTNTSNISIGKSCLIQDRVYLRAGLDGRIEIGDGAALNSFVQMYGHGGITVGDDAQIGPNTVVTTTGHDYMATDLNQNYAAIRIGKRVWVGANCTILPGVTIGDQSVIGAGAVVSKNIPARCVALGVPARVVRRFDQTDNAESTTLQEVSEAGR